MPPIARPDLGQSRVGQGEGFSEVSPAIASGTLESRRYCFGRPAGRLIVDKASFGITE